MSEANPPFNRPDPSESVDSLSLDAQRSLSDLFLDAMSEMDGELATEGEESQFADEQDIFPVENVPIEKAALSETTSGAAPVPADSLTMAPGSEAWLASPETTDLADLISLIQELNQCNSILLDRVSQLEEALERSQSALKAEVKRSQTQNQVDFSSYDPAIVSEDLATAQEQVVELYGQLEFVHQTNQRQQILVETLTGQLEASQERVAQLEREAALVQQRYNEQTQLLMQYENNCRDLQSRLHRQQRYTLQFKAALEKSLEVSASPYESVAQAVAASENEQFFLPKVQRIQPWVSPEFLASQMAWMKSSMVIPSDTTDDPTTDDLAGLGQSEEQVMDSLSFPKLRTHRRSLAAVKLPGFGNPLPQPVDPEADQQLASPDSAEAGTPVVSHHMKQTNLEHSADGVPVNDETFRQKIDAAVQPLADMLAEAMRADPPDASFNAGSEALLSENRQVVAPDEIAAVEQPLAAPDEALLDAVMADAEDALWQDLARLIDVSTEDVVKASLSGDFSAFESIDFNALQPPRSAPASEPENAKMIAPPSPHAHTSDPWSEPQEDRSTQPNSASEAPSVPGLESNPGWPAPLVYPLRPTKKRRSLAAVELPSFLQPPEPDALPT